MIRSVTLDDLPTLVAIDRQSNPHPWTLAQYESALQSDQLIWVVENDQGMVCAFLVWQKTLDEAEIYNIAVAKSFRRNRFGQRLLDKMLEQCRESGVHKIFLEVRRSNTGAQAFYRDNLFRQIAVRKDYYTIGIRYEDALIMERLC